MDKAWQAHLTVFVLFNLVGVPLIGQLAWLTMEGLRDGAIALAVIVSVLTAAGILAANVLFTLRVGRAGAPQGVLLALWAVTGLTFALTVGTGFFSPVMLVWALVAW